MSSEAVEQLHEDWRKLGADPLIASLKLPKLRPARISRTEARFTDRALVEKSVTDLEASAMWIGWSRRESEMSRTPTKERLSRSGAPLDGEWVSADGAQSIRLVCDGGWRLITLSEVEAAGEAALAEETQLLAMSGGFLTYTAYWSFGTGQQPALRRLCARFTGFVEA